MNAKKYFDKNGKIYGVSYKYMFGWKCYTTTFTDFAEAEKWLDTEEYDFRTRILCSKTKRNEWIALCR